MKFGAAGQLNAASEQTPVSCMDRLLDRLAHALYRIAIAFTVVDGHPQMRPAHNIRVQGSKFADFPFLDGDQVGAFGPVSRIWRPWRLPGKTTCGFSWRIQPRWTWPSAQ